jgi:tetratricopeptide (TPR) repeat protein
LYNVIVNYFRRLFYPDANGLSRKVNGPEHPDTIRALHALALSYPRAQALALREEAFALSRKVNGPDSPSTERAAYNLDLSYSAVGRDQDALKVREELVRVSMKIYGPEHRRTLRALDRLERAYYAAGRWQDALRMKADYARWNPNDLNASLPVMQLWFGKDADYTATCRRLLKFAEGTQLPTTAERAAKSCLLRPVSDPEQLDQILALARRAVELGADHQFLGWFQLALGMAEYRRGDYPAADKALHAAEEMAPVNARFFLAMSQFKQGHFEEARRWFDRAAAEMPPFPDDDLNPLAGEASADDMIVWLAYKEAKAILGAEDSRTTVATWVRKLQETAAEHPDDSVGTLRLALVLCWSGKLTEHEALCRKLLEAAAQSEDPAIHDRAAKAYLLRPRPEPQMLKLAAASARKTLILARPGDELYPWFLTVAGAAACREGQPSEADALLDKAIQAPLHENQRRLALAFRAMARLQAGKVEEARADLAEIEKAHLPVPDHTRMSAVLRDQDQLAVRLAYDEAKAKLSEAQPVAATGSR